MTKWSELTAKRRKALKWVSGLGHDYAVSPNTIEQLIEEGYLGVDGTRLFLTVKGSDAWDQCPEWEKK